MRFQGLEGFCGLGRRISTLFKALGALKTGAELGLFCNDFRRIRS